MPHNLLGLHVTTLLPHDAHRLRRGKKSHRNYEFTNFISTANFPTSCNIQHLPIKPPS